MKRQRPSLRIVTPYLAAFDISVSRSVPRPPMVLEFISLEDICPDFPSACFYSVTLSLFPPLLRFILWKDVFVIPVLWFPCATPPGTLCLDSMLNTRVVPPGLLEDSANSCCGGGAVSVTVIRLCSQKQRPLWTSRRNNNVLLWRRCSLVGFLWEKL